MAFFQFSWTGDSAADDEIVFYLLAAFEDEARAASALEEALKRLKLEADLPFGEVAVGQSGELIWSRVAVRPEELVKALEAFELPGLP